jgi:propionyl-CoA carboxylase alpha chain
MFKRILIANRGEIACRIIRTARSMGIETVAVHSEADAAAPHVEQADTAIAIGPPPAAQSYLLGERIIEAARATGAEAIHPGYGFLSEREWFVQAVEEAGLVFIGPPASAIAAMGDKIQSKKLAQGAGVSVVPGFVGEIEDSDHAARIAADIGYPVMMKASAGGGGKGMRLAYAEAELREGFDAVRREAMASFGDDRLFIEKFIEQPRHIEIQLLGDRHGNILHLGERDCSIQRRHQKVVEESPSPFVTPEMRAAMGAQAVELARAVGYHSAGTVEFIAGADRSFYFLEMNTRLQVEHPVTECVTGLDLVELMIRVAAGEPLPFAQGDVRMDGHAIETRLYAEDPYRGFLPSTGRLTRYREPPARAGARVDSGVVEGSDISMFYDPMIAKLITHGASRGDAIARQVRALDGFMVRGISHNGDFLSALMQHPRFLAGDHVTTGFIAEEYAQGFTGAPDSPERRRRIILLMAALAESQARRAATIDGQLARMPWRDHAHWIIDYAGEQVPVEVHSLACGDVRLVLDDRPATIGQDRIEGFVGGVLDIEINDPDPCPLSFQIDPLAVGHRVTHRGRQTVVRALTPRTAALARHMIEKVPPDLSRFLLCPMPGLVVSIAVAEGETVQPGQPLAVVEAMKMENVLRAEKAATVAKLHATPGDSLAVDQVILEFA